MPWWVRASARVAGWAAPEQVARAIGRRLTVTRRRPRSEAELAFRATARRVELALDEARIVAWELGSGPAVLLMHGWDGSAGDFAHLAPALAAAGLRAVAIDAPGHGDADGTEADAVRMARALQLAADALGPARAVVAHSFGAPAVAVAVQRGWAVERVALLAPEADLAGYVRALADLGGPAVHARVREDLRRRVGMYPEEVRVSAALTPSAPLVVHDLDDRVVPFDLVAAAFPQVLRTSGLGHRRVLADPAVIAAVVAHVSGHRARACPHRYVEGGCPQCALALDLYRPAARGVG